LLHMRELVVWSGGVISLMHDWSWWNRIEWKSLWKMNVDLCVLTEKKKWTEWWWWWNSVEVALNRLQVLYSFSQHLPLLKYSYYQGLIDFLVLYVCEFFVLAHVSCFSANKFLNIPNLLVLVSKIKMRRKIWRKICTKTVDFPANFDFMD
jgi:hypothetical protein